MRKFLFLFLLLGNVSICNAQTPIFNITNGIISINKNMIDKFDDGSNDGFDMTKLSYTLKHTRHFSAGSTNLVLKTGNFDDWDNNDSIGFNVINIYREESKIFELKQLDNWTYVYNGGSTIDFGAYTDSRYYIPINLVSHNAKALVFLGWPYGGDLPYLTILVVTEQDVKLVFNKRMGVRSIDNTDCKFIMKVQTILDETDSSGNLCVAPTYSNIYLENGILYLK